MKGLDLRLKQILRGGIAYLLVLGYLILQIGEAALG